jgi:hypothetical protein
MNLRQNTRAILHDEAYDYFPVVHFGYWDDTVRKWQAEGHLPTDLADPAGGRSAEQIVSQTLGFDFGWGDCAGGITACCRRSRPGLSKHCRTDNQISR